MKRVKNQKITSVSNSFQSARNTPPRGAASSSSSSEKPVLSIEGMETVNAWRVRQGKPPAYSARLIARRREELGISAPPAKKRSPVRPTMLVERLRALATDWFREGRMRGFSPRTLRDRELSLERFFWFVGRESFEIVGREEIEAYLLHVRTGHEEPEGRFGTGKTNPRAFDPVRPNTYRYHWDVLATFFSFQTKKGLWEKSPFENIEAAQVPEDTDVKPFSNAEVEALLAAAKKGTAPYRDYAIILFLMDTGVRASELCDITFADVDEKTNAVRIKGKGGKYRTVYFGEKTARALWKHIGDIGLVWGEDARKPTAPLFASERGTRAGENILPRALLALMHRTGKRAGVNRVHPHRFRHTFAVNFLRNGGNQISLMRFLGHTDLTMTKHYVQFVEADLEEQHRKFSPGDRLRG